MWPILRYGLLRLYVTRPWNSTKWEVVAKVDVLSTEGQLAQAYLQQTQAGHDIDVNKATLNLLLRFPQETPIDIIQDLSQ